MIGERLSCRGDYTASAQKTGTIDVGSSIVSGGTFAEKQIDGQAYMVLPMAAASATFVRDNQIFVRADNMPSGAFLMDAQGNKSYDEGGSQRLTLTIDETPKTVEIRAGQTYEVTFTNTKKSGFTIKKIDEDTRQPLKNAIFSISKANGEIVKDRAETDENGVITLTGLPDCTLIVTEIEAPDGYILQDMPKTIEVKAGGNYEMTFTNKRAYGLQIRKVIKGTNQPLDGCTFTVEKANGEMVGSYTTDSSGLATVTSLEDGVYVVTEVSCPEGYRLDTEPQNVIVKAGELATVTFENEKLAGVRIKKIDAVTGEGIYGVRFLIKDEYNNLLGEYSTDQDGYIELDDLLTDGKSEIKIKVEEIAAAEGYVLDDTVRTLRIRRGETPSLLWKTPRSSVRFRWSKSPRRTTP